MEYIVGITLALFFCAAAAGLGMDRERAFYPAVAIAVASYYLAFAVVDGRNEVTLSEVIIAAVFIVAAVAGFKRSPWFAVVALCLPVCPQTSRTNRSSLPRQASESVIGAARRGTPSAAPT